MSPELKLSLYNKILSFIKTKEYPTWKEIYSQFHLEVDSVSQLREYLTLIENRTTINHVWLSHSGKIMTADNEEIVDNPKDCPQFVDKREIKTWHTPKG